MHIKINKMDGPARICDVTDNQNIVQTPNMFFLSLSRFKKPNSSDFLLKEKRNNNEFFKIHNNIKNNITIDIPKLIDNDYNFQIINSIEDIQKIEINKKECYIFIIGNSLFKYKNQNNFVDFIINLRKKIGYKHLIYLPTIANISNISLFSYMGVDLFDCIPAILSARNKELFFQYGNQNINQVKKIPCSCRFCKNYINKPNSMPFENILKHNYEMLLNELINIKNHIFNGLLRNLVEIRVKTNVDSTALLRIIDNKHYRYIEENTPIVNNNILFITHKESYNRPEIKRFQQRLINNYKKPKDTKILLLLPCSAKKPYSFSKSHKKFRQIIKNIENHNIIHEMIITSPLGLVPRDLELVYPAANYDIPVTGEWDNDEKKIISSLLKKYLLINKYDKIISFLPSNISKVILESNIKFIDTNVINSMISKKSLTSLDNILKKECKNYPKLNTEKRKIQNIESILSFQFNEDIANTFVRDCKIKGRYPYLKIYNQNYQVGMLTKEKGLITFTLRGIENIMSFNKNFIEIYDDINLKGSLLAPGIKNADRDIRIGDEVYILKNNKLYAVGTAKMNGKNMINFNYGEAASIRHKV
jgi:archaeosine synthase